ncbi:MAG: ribonuclease HII [Candidatus Aenigmatarchaeota archaeon]
MGPMVIAGVAINKKDEKKLVKIGVRDSKELSEEKREELAEKIEKIAKDILVLRVQPCKIDTLRAKGINLDKIEAMKMAEIIEMIDVDKIYVDSLEQNSTRFKDLIKSFLKTKLNVELIVENYLDESVPVVSAASIIAKVERDKVIEELKRKINYDFGVGYPHDERTIEFLKKIIKESSKRITGLYKKKLDHNSVFAKRFVAKKIKRFFQ